MKVSIDSILGSARKISSQRQIDDENLSNKKKEIKSDSVNISRKVDSRLDKIESEFRDLQTSLTKNQITRLGIENLSADMEKGGRNRDKILNETQYEGKKVLHSYVGDNTDRIHLEAKGVDIGKSIDTDISKLKKLQVEVDNITASSLAGQDKAENIMTNISSFFGKIGSGKIENYSNLKVDAVMKLIK